MPFYADILPMRKGNFRGGEYTKAKSTITENFQFSFCLKEKNSLSPLKKPNAVLASETLSICIAGSAKELWLINKASSKTSANW
ncbi:hypothetical protein HRJ35_16130 [Shewanella oneidensis MR-1]|uniref:hypothetical protein n=1 Tax=Shewanella oneidensis TaxID=70863 RepID=UPI0013E8F51A|nr:hypothetical protein [Shewanella oneidensis]MDX5999632.1 hypothetical protein [Shewanella oneidensis]MEE2028617.1 hypothetical protein [Shewanella oneidensis]QKG97379.1 hypothetical protein HRJ35_16130 [Shewanella oneidensis MR-1]